MEEESRYNQDNHVEDDNLYIYHEEGDEESAYDDLDDSPLNYSQIEEENDIPEEDDDQQGKQKKRKSPFLLMLKILSNPVEGWKDTRRAHLTVEEAQQKCFYPLLAIMAACKFADLYYSPALSISDIVVEGVTSFVGLFAGYFCIILLLKFLLPGKGGKVFDTEFGKVFVIMSLSTLSLFFALTELLQMLWAVLIFLPLWTVYSVCKGIRFLNFPEDKTIRSTALLCLLIVGVPVLIQWGLDEVLPK